MTESEFWALIDRAAANAANPDARVDGLKAALTGLSADDLAAFRAHYDHQLDASYTWPLWGAAYVMMGGCSDDSFDYFRDWLISEGQAVFEAAVANPETLADLPRVDEPELELFRYVAGDAYEALTGQDMPITGQRVHDPAGEEWDEDDVDSLFPRLAAIYA